MKNLNIKNRQNYQRTHRHGSVLLHARLPREFFGAPFKVFGFGAQFLTNIRYLIEFFTPIQYFVNIFAHNGMYFGQVFGQLRFVVLIATRRIAVFALFALNDGIVVNELKRTRRLIHLQAPLSKCEK